ncbi:MAG: TauD/TfdA family dioxygenase [Proteobacteria bacterium]|nr:TauD/TfdA family dioxygenase [Pseudomonadota bacterium]
MGITITALADRHACTLGASVTGVDLRTLTNAEWPVIAQAFAEHALLVFPAQHLDDDAQLAFARRFGEIEVLVEGKTTIAISNRGEQGQPLRDDSVFMQLLRGNEGWHTDSSYMPLAAKASVLSARVVPEAGGETEWADMRAAYDALDVDMQARLERLSAFHSLFYSQSRIGAVAKVGDYYGFNAGDAPRRPLVKVHPETGRRALFIGRHACNIPGMETAESEAFLDALMDFACRAPRVYRHRWQAGDIVVWDNRCLLHRARPYDYREPRVMMHTRIRGNPDTESALA